jgi:hypothetical protein
MLSVSWNEPNAKRRNLKADELLFELVYKSSNQLSRTSLKLSDDKIVREAFDGKYMLLGLQLDAAPIMKFNTFTEESNSALRVYPNPANDFAVVALNLVKESQIAMKLIDVSGKTLAVKNYGSMSGMMNIELNTATLQSGVYIVEFTVDNDKLVKRLVVE